MEGSSSLRWRGPPSAGGRKIGYPRSGVFPSCSLLSGSRRVTVGAPADACCVLSGKFFFQYGALVWQTVIRRNSFPLRRPVSALFLLLHIHIKRYNYPFLSPFRTMELSRSSLFAFRRGGFARAMMELVLFVIGCFFFDDTSS